MKSLEIDETAMRYIFTLAVWAFSCFASFMIGLAVHVTHDRIIECSQRIPAKPVFNPQPTNTVPLTKQDLETVREFLKP